LLSELLVGLQVAAGSLLQVRARTADGRSFGWEDLERMVECTQRTDRPPTAEELPLDGASIVAIDVTPATEGAAAAAGQSAARSQLPTVRVLMAAPYASTLTDSFTAVSPESSAPEPLRLHPLFAFADALIGRELAAMLAVDVATLQRVRWR
jgi:hypothetical protein